MKSCKFMSFLYFVSLILFSIVMIKTYTNKELYNHNKQINLLNKQVKELQIENKICNFKIKE